VLCGVGGRGALYSLTTKSKEGGAVGSSGLSAVEGAAALLGILLRGSDGASGLRRRDGGAGRHTRRQTRGDILGGDTREHARVQPQDARPETPADGQDLRSNSLHLGDDRRLDEAVEVNTAEAEQAGIEDAAVVVDTAKVETGEVERVEDTDLSELLEIRELLEQEEVLELELVVTKAEEAGEAVDVEVVLRGQELEDTEVEVVDVAQVVQVGRLAEVLEVAERVGIKVEPALLNLLLASSRGRSSQSGKSRHEESGRLHLACVE
jgi:hypothetical protein